MKSLYHLFDNLTNIQKSLIVSILAITLFVASAGISYSISSQIRGGGGITEPLVTALPGPATPFIEDPKEPRTESCPLNGSMHTKKARDNWATRLPLAVMIENHTEARPQSGLSSADIVYEAVAEGGITRFMALYYCNLADVQVGPVRSARTYFLDWLGEYDALYAHVGGANTPGPANALGQIIKYEVKDLNQFSIGFPTFWRDYQRLGHPVATEHTMYSTTQKLWEIGAKKGWTAKDETNQDWAQRFTPWKFKEDNTTSKDSGAAAANVNVEFWQGYSDYSVTWDFDATCNCYKRKNGGLPHMDLNTNQQLSATNVVVQLEREARANDGYEGNLHLIYKTTGEGKALIFQGGTVTIGKWVKQLRTTRTKYLDANGKEISFARGVIWVQTVPEGAKVSY